MKSLHQSPQKECGMLLYKQEQEENRQVITDRKRNIGDWEAGLVYLIYIQTRANLFVFLYGLKKTKESICMGL